MTDNVPQGPIGRLKSEILRLRDTATWSISGLKTAWVEEKSFRQWVILNLISWGILAYFEFSVAEAGLLFALGAWVLVVELINSAIEATVDFVSTERHPLAKKAKDIASAAVMLSGLTWLISWVIVLSARVL